MLIVSSGQDSYFYQLFVDKDDHVVLPTTQQLLELSFLQSDVKLSEVCVGSVAQRSLSSVLYFPSQLSQFKTRMNSLGII
jgi:hypothetical protein